MRTIANDNVFEARSWTLSWLAVLFLLFDSAGKLLQVQPVIDGTLQNLAGILPAHVVLGRCYRHLGGTVATQAVLTLSAGSDSVLRDARLRALLPIRRAS